MKILVFGGTLFLGRHVVEAALARGHEVTLFNRGVTNPDLFPEVEKLKGDRDGDLTALQGRRWDAVVDPSGYSPRIVRASVELLADAVDHYSFVSSVDIYVDAGDEPIDENWKVAAFPDENAKKMGNPGSKMSLDKGIWERVSTDEAGTSRKALCEHIVQEVMPGRALVYRAGLIVGPHDRTDRFTYWARRVSQGGKVLAPGYPEWPQQIIDVRDLAEWNVRMAESRQDGVYNTGGPDYRLTMGRILDECKAVTGSDAELVWVDGEFLIEQGEQSYDGMPPFLDNALGLIDMNRQKAIKAGLTFRPLADTITDSLEWDAERDLDAPIPFPLPVRVGPSLEREKELLEAWARR